MAAAPEGAIVALYVDLRARVNLDDVIETTTGRRYQVIGVRLQQRGERRGRQHVRAIVLPRELEIPAGVTVHKIRWYRR